MKRVREIAKSVVYISMLYLFYYILSQRSYLAGNSINVPSIVFMEIVFTCFCFKLFKLKKSEILLLMVLTFVELGLGYYNLIVSIVALLGVLALIIYKLEVGKLLGTIWMISIIVGFLMAYLWCGAAYPYLLLLIMLLIELYILFKRREPIANIMLNVLKWGVQFGILWGIGRLFCAQGLPKEYQVSLFEDKFFIAILLVSFSARLVLIGKWQNDSDI